MRHVATFEHGKNQWCVQKVEFGSQPIVAWCQSETEAQDIAHKLNSQIRCCDLMIHATEHAIIRTTPPRFGPDVLDQPLNNINYCPWCGAAMTKAAWDAESR